VSIERLK